MLGRIVVVLGLIVGMSGGSWARSESSEPELTIVGAGSQRVWRRSELLAHPERKDLAVTLPAYPGQSLTVTAVPVSALFRGLSVASDATIVFRCTDGYSGALEKSRLLTTAADAARAYLAIEPNSGWPALPIANNPKKLSAGPFYIFWEHPERSAVSTNEWPYQLTELKVEHDFAALFPKVMPARGVKDQAVAAGFAAFRKNCLPCHTMNGQGPAAVGPDLNEPMSPVEYFRDGILERFLADPKAVRAWPAMRMYWLEKAPVDATEIAAIIAYLKHMAVERPGRKP